MTTLRRALRLLLHTPGFAVGATLTFALGVGVNLAVFSAVDRVLFRPLPYRDPDQLVVMRLIRNGSVPSSTIAARYVVRARLAPGVEELTVSRLGRYAFRFTENPDDARSYSFAPMAWTTLRTLGVRPIVGRDFTEEDARLNRPLALISYTTWQQSFGGRNDIVGQPMWGSVGRFEVAGVLPDDFLLPQLQTPMPWSGIALTRDTFEDTPGVTSLPSPVLRLKPGVSLAQAQAQVDAIAVELGPQFPAREGTPASFVRLEPLRDLLVGRYTVYAGVVLAAALMVLMVTCANLASLLLARGRSRESRVAVQVALGASPHRIIQTSIVEALVLALGGAAVALVVLRLTRDALTASLPPAFTAYTASLFEIRVLLFSLALATVSAVLAAVLPGWRASRVDPLPMLQRGAARGLSGRLRGSGPLVAIEVALSTVLVLGAIMMGRTLINYRASDVGFEPDGLFTVGAVLPPTNDNAQLLRQYAEVLATLRPMPAVHSAAAADTLPMVGAMNRPLIPGQFGGQRVPATDGLIETLGMRVIAGRTIGAEELRTMAPVGMLSLKGLELVWPGVSPQEAIGRFLDIPGEQPLQIVAVVSDVRPMYLAPVEPTLYRPMGADGLNSIGVMFAVRMRPGQTLTTADLSRQLRAQGLAPKSITVESVEARFDSAIVNHSFRARLFGTFAMVSLALAVIGIYAVQAFSVAQRRTELGIRIALGATRLDLWRLLLRESVGPVIAGVAVGLVGAYWASGLVQSFLFGVDPQDPWTFAVVATLLIAVAAGAVWMPARHASRADPALVLRPQ